MMNKEDQALVESYHHWEDNVESYPYRGNEDDKRKWFRAKCGPFQCPLCLIYNASIREGYRSPTCKECPVGPSACFEEYDRLERLIAFGYSRKHHVEAVRDRLKAECEKRELL